MSAIGIGMSSLLLLFRFDIRRAEKNGKNGSDVCVRIFISLQQDLEFK